MFTFGTLQTAVNKLIHYAAPPAAPPSASLSRTSVAAHATPYMRDGPLEPARQPRAFTAAVGAGPGGGTVEVRLEAHYPGGGAGWPLVLISPGFLLNASLYRSYAASLASWGCVACLVDVVSPTLLDDAQSATFLRRAVDACAADAALGTICDAANVMLVGHSRGAKISALAAAEDPRVKALALIDPVDSSSYGPSGPGYPSALPGLTAAGGGHGGRGALPVLVIGAGANADVVEAGANWAAFAEAAAAGGAPAWEVVLLSCGHLQFVDKRMGLFSIFSSRGETSDEDVRLITQSALAAWSQIALLPAAGLAPPPAAGAEAAVAAERAALSRVAPLVSREWNLGALGGPALEGAAAGAHGAARGGEGAAAPARGAALEGAAAAAAAAVPALERAAAVAAAAPARGGGAEAAGLCSGGGGGGGALDVAGGVAGERPAAYPHAGGGVLPAPIS
ncbi:MAG: Alpha/Beta hydrolase protein [Monoraphidium minutum]|nr:MAG: Alpha/Beta hydrolase protein [Monoraphidium minutum]